MNLPEHLLGHPVHVYEDLIDDETFEELNKYIRELGSDSIAFPSNQNQKGLAEVHIGEKEPIGQDGSCSNLMLFPDYKKENCLIPSRMDIGQHYSKTGGDQALREPFEELFGRVSTFGRYMYDLENYPYIANLFKSDKFQSSAKSICPAGK